MLSILKSPYPCIYGQKENIYTAVAVGIFVSSFLIIFEPFSISESKDSLRLLKTAGFGVVCFLVELIFYFVLPKIFKSFFIEKNYTLGKELIASAGLILLIGLANGIYAQLVLNEEAMVSMPTMIWQTFLIGIFPLTFLSMIQFNRQTRINLKASNEIVLPKITEKSNSIELKATQYFSLSADQANNKVNLNDLLYLESDGNYAYLHHLKDGIATKSMHRTTLKQIEEENELPNIFRCHRSYIVNLDQVVEVNGNAQGLKLSIKNCDDIVPVSKKYIPAFKDYFYKGA